ncbi:hypothetical protein [Aminivibrio sp.]|uniref:hypothetical protein n=1 Tax=Aminivibrio sp. TaxID=1872489 RepID=UPI001A63FA7D|nr:hypothetical protein [Aminivibrio sp.]MBL3539831.1 hypothetical protein [Aminivibrio sp.]MDK2959625.1 hypothetical protein [Synergistaceae bacterium]
MAAKNKGDDTMGTETKKNPRKTGQPSPLARQIRIIFYTVFICITIVLLAVSLDLMINPSKNWTDSLAIRWISERRNMLPFFR